MLQKNNSFWHVKRYNNWIINEFLFNDQYGHVLVQEPVPQIEILCDQNLGRRL